MFEDCMKAAKPYSQESQASVACLKQITNLAITKAMWKIFEK